MKYIPYIVIVFLVFITSYLGSLITNSGMSWYKSINIPSWTPPGFVIGIVWTFIFICLAISMALFWKNTPISNIFYVIVGIFILNLLLNIFWSFLFFGIHKIDLAVIEAIVLDVSVIVLIVLIYPFTRIGAYLLLPYAFWTAFASYLTYSVSFLNR